MIDAAMGRTCVVNCRSQQMVFAVPNQLCQYRADTFETKEPETLEWLDSLPPGSTFWDVGANVGLYAVYAAKARNCSVYAFEPSVFNLELLARNIVANDLQKKITVVPLALGDALAIGSFEMSSIAWGGALSTFAHGIDQNGAAIKRVFEYQMLGLSLNEAVSLLRIPPPHSIKVDVDGIEHRILRGGAEVLSNVASVLIEINDNFAAQSEEATRHLKNAGLSLYRKCDLGVSNVHNQWWRRTD